MNDNKEYRSIVKKFHDFYKVGNGYGFIPIFSRLYRLTYNYYNERLQKELGITNIESIHLVAISRFPGINQNDLEL